jgi:hypothetical protein
MYDIEMLPMTNATQSIAEREKELKVGSFKNTREIVSLNSNLQEVQP